MNFDNSYANLPEAFRATVRPEVAPAPQLLAWNDALSTQLGLDTLASDQGKLAKLFGGGATMPGMQPVAMAYAGHQFGHFVPQLGDGRAVLLGEIVDAQARRFDIQLKGSGRTPYSRRGDGKSWLGPVLREYILSEAMHRLGVPTTRALAAVATGETVIRDSQVPGGVFTRVASSHLRVGTFQYFAARGDTKSLETLADYAIDRHFPELRQESSPYLGLFKRVLERQATLVAHWMAIGFIHGVMNTDNTSISGETIDYGPAAFLDEFNFNKVFSSIDQFGRYAYGAQPDIAQWNLARLAETLLVLGVDKRALEDSLNAFENIYGARYVELMAPKLGLRKIREGDDTLIATWLQHLDEHALDYTLSFRELSSRIDATDDAVFGEFERQWRARVGDQEGSTEQSVELMNSVNPLFIPRNHRVEEAIRAAVDGDLSVFRAMNKALEQPYDEQPEHAEYARAPEVQERVTRTFCGT